MPVVSIPEKDMVVRFPYDMDPKEIERQIYIHVYDTPVLSQGEATGFEKAKQFIGDLFRREGPKVGPLTDEDIEAFAAGTTPPPKPDPVQPETIPPELEDRGRQAQTATQEPEIDLTTGDIPKYLAYAPYLAVKAVHGVMGPALPALKAMGMDTEGLLTAATEYWRKQIGESVQIPNVGIGRDEEGNLRFEPREPIPFADLLGTTAEIGGAVTGPVRAALGAGGLVAEKLSRYARPFYRSIVKGMIGGALLGEGKKDETLQNMALFGVFEPLAFALGAASKIPQIIKDSTPWRRMTIRERGLVIQSFDDAIKANPNITEGEILRTWNNPTWRKEVTRMRERAFEERRFGEGAEPRPEPPVEPAPPPVTPEPPGPKGLPAPRERGKKPLPPEPTIGLGEGEPKPTAAYTTEQLMLSDEMIARENQWKKAGDKVFQRTKTVSPEEVIGFYKKKYDVKGIVEFSHSKPAQLLDDKYRAAETTSFANKEGRFLHVIKIDPWFKGRRSELGMLRHELEHVKDVEEGYLEGERHHKHYIDFDREYVEEKPQAPGEGKELWEMTKEEFATVQRKSKGVAAVFRIKGQIYKTGAIHDFDQLPKNVQLLAKKEGFDLGFIDKDGKFFTIKDRPELRLAHHEFVKQAISEGKPVPANVLAEYPDLAPKEPETIPFDNLSDRAKGAIASDARERLEPPEAFVKSQWVPEKVSIESLKDENASVWEGGFVERGSMTKGPLIVDDKGVVLDGNNRLREAIERGDREIDILRRLQAPEPTPTKPPAEEAPPLTVYPGDYIKFRTPGGTERYGDVSKVFEGGNVSVIPDGAKGPIPISPEQVVNLEKAGRIREVKELAEEEEVLEVPEAPEAEEAPEAKPGKELTLKEHKESLLAEIDKAIEAAPSARPTKTKGKKGEYQYEENIPWDEIPGGKGFVEITIDGTKYRFHNLKSELQEIRKSVKALAVGVPSRKPKKPSMPKPSAHKRERIGELAKITEGGKGWFTDGFVVVKGVPPKNAKKKMVGDKQFEAPWDEIKSKSIEAPNQIDAELRYFATKEDLGDLEGVSIAQMPKFEKGITTYAVFKAGKKRYAFDQEKYNVINNRYPDAKYKIVVDEEGIGSLLIAYDKGKPVGAVSGLEAFKRQKDVPGIKMAAKAGMANIGRFSIGGDILLPGRYLKVSFREPGGTKKTVFLKNISESDKFLRGTEVNKEGEEVVPKGFDERLRIIERGVIFSSTEYRMHKRYGTLEKLPEGEAEGQANIGKFTTGQDFANVGGYATSIQNVLQMPEIVLLARELLGGRYPKVREILSSRVASGLFRPSGKGDIFLRADIFKDPAQAAAILAHEIGHLVDWLPEKYLRRGNILGRIASLKGFLKHTLPRFPKEPEVLTEKDRRRLRSEAKKLIEAENADKWIDEVITRELPISPDDVLAIWNTLEDARLLNPELYEFIARLNTAEKKSIVKEALKGQIDERLRQFAKIITEKTGKRIKATVTKGMIYQRYVDLLNKEIQKRRAFTRSEIMDEVKTLSRAWKPFNPSADPKYTAYRYKPEELYADAFSALINAPGFLKATAPRFYEAFFNYMEKKPQVKALYELIQDDITSGKIEKKRVENLFDMFRRGDDAYSESLKKKGKFWDLLAREMIDTNWFLLKKTRQLNERNIPAGDNPRYKLEEMAYSGSEAELYLTTLYRQVVKPLEKNNITWDQFGEYLYHSRVSTERAELANPQGWTPHLSKKRMEEIKGNLSPGQASTLVDAKDAFRELRLKMVIDKAEAAGIYSKDLIELMKDSENYATFDVVAYINKRYGRGPGAKIYRQIGTLQEISNPATATVMKDNTLIKSINRQIAAKSVTDFLKKNYPNDIRPAEKQWNGKISVIKDPPEDEGLILYLDKGKMKGYYVSKEIAEMFDQNPMESNVIAKVLSVTIQPFRKLFTELNYGFWMFNIIRDFYRAGQMLPKAKLSTFLPHYLKGIRPAFKSVFGVPDAVTDEMLKDNMLISIADIHGLRPEDKQIERLLKMYHIKPGQWESKITTPFGKMFTYFTNIGRGFERATKVGSYHYLKKKFPDMTPEEIGHIVRVRGGSPDFLRKGRGYPIYNNILMFSNAMKEGYRGDYEAGAENPAAFMWKKFKYAYLPKLLMYAVTLGLLGRDTQKIMEGASEYDKTNYTIIPLGLTESGKSVYLRVPMDESSRLMGGILWKTLNHQDLGWGDLSAGMFDYMAGQAPTIHPGIEALVAVVQYASGLNPYDHFRGRYAIPEQVFLAGGERKHKAFARWMANKSGASIVYKFKYDDVGKIKTELETVIGYPFLSNILGRFIKVTDQGVREGLRVAKKEVRSANTRALLDAKDALNKWISGETLNNEEIQAILAKPDIIDRNIMVGLARKYGAVYLEEFMTATSIAEKAAVLNKLFEKQALETNLKGEENP